MSRASITSLAPLIAILAIASCTTQPKPPNLGDIYNRAAQEHRQRNPIIVIPGILGSRLVADQPDNDPIVVWGAFGGGAANPRKSAGVRLIALPMQRGVSLGDLRDDVRADGALETLDLSLFGIQLQLKAYANILASLGAGGYTDQSLATIDYGKEHFTCFQFDYDWRRDIVENASRLHEFIEEKAAFVRSRRDDLNWPTPDPITFDIVAHSMGGLVLRYYLRYGDADLPADGSTPTPTWVGANRVDKAILIGTPSAGSTSALTDLIEGREFSALLPNYPPALLGTMPAVYQLLPRPRHNHVVDASTKQSVNLFDPELWQQNHWGLASPDQAGVLQMLLPQIDDLAQRSAIAIEHQAKCLRRAEHLARALDQSASPPAGLQLHLFAGDAQKTLSRIEVKPDGSLDRTRHAPGDGVVLRSSALLDERLALGWSPNLDSPIHWSRVQFLFLDHLAMTKDAAFTDNLLYLLLEEPRQ